MDLTQLPSFNNLKAFAAAAKFGSFKRAANALNVTPTAISHQIKTLEDHLKVKLFDRKIRAISLTPEGQKLALTTQSIFNQLEATLSEIQSAHAHVRISCCTSFATLWLAPRLPEFQKAHPDIQIEICASDHTIDINNQRSIHLAIRYGLAAAENSEEIYLCTEMMRAYKSANVSHGDRQKDSLFVVNWQDNPDLENLPWQTYYDPTAFRITYFEQEQYVLQATLTGQGVGLLSDILCSASINQQWLLPIPSMPAFPGYSYSLRTSVHARNNRFVHIVRDWLVTKLSQPEKQC